jgi:hypothetical protein
MIAKPRFKSAPTKLSPSAAHELPEALKPNASGQSFWAQLSLAILIYSQMSPIPEQFLG